MKMKRIQIKNLKSFFDADGELFETLRSDDPFYGGNFGQNLISIVKPGVIKGLHLHHNQVEYTTCIKGNILYVAIEENQNSPPNIEKFVIGESSRLLIKTPPGIWHGYTPLNNQEAVILYTMNKPYDPKDPDTEEKDVLSFGNIWTLE